MLATHISPATNSQQLAAFAIGKICTLIERTLYLIPKFRKLNRDRSVSIAPYDRALALAQALVDNPLRCKKQC